MKNYTKNEMQEMQRQAIQRVQEMQRRAEQTRQQANLDIIGKKETENTFKEKAHPASSPTFPKTDEPSRNIKIADSPKRISLPVEFPENKGRTKSHFSEQSEAANSELTEKTQKKGLLESIDQDKALILALILLLSSEGVDLQLILALLYIMY